MKTTRYTFPSMFASAALASLTALTAQLPDTLLYSIPAPFGGVQPGGWLGSSVAIEGNYAVVGASHDDASGSDSGVAKVFDSTTGALTHVLSDSSIGTNSFAGVSVAISGARVVVGRTAGASVYDLSSGTPTVPVVVLGPPGGAGSFFGQAVAISGTWVVVGAYTGGAQTAGSVYVYDLSTSTSTVPVLTLNNPSPNSGDAFGSAVAISGTRVVVGANGDDTSGGNAGSVYVFDLGSFTPALPVASLNNPGPNPNEGFGKAVAISGTRVVAGGATRGTYVYDLATGASPVATLNSTVPFTTFGSAVAISGTRVVVGSANDATGASESGGTYVYDLSSGTPGVPVATVPNPNPASGDHFGNAVAISGALMLIGAHHDDLGAVDAGTAYLFDLGSASPTVPTATLHSPGPALNDRFGISTAISGTRVLVGADQDDTGGPNAGSAYVFDLLSGTPTVPVVALTNPSPANQFFGWSVALSGTRAIVGSPFDSTGSAYVYDLSSATPSVAVAKLANPSPANSDAFGNAVAISGTLVVVGAWNDDTGATDAGSAYIYNLGSVTPAVPVATLTNPSPAAGDNFGSSVAISGTWVAISALNDDTGATDSGSVYVYNLNSPTPAVPVATLSNPSPATKDNFGLAVAVSGTRVAVVAWKDDTGATDAGSAYVYDLSSGTPSLPVATLNNPNPATGDSFGSSISISGTRLVVGAIWDDAGALDAGTAYVYDLSSGSPTTPVTTLRKSIPAVSDTFGYSVAIDGTFVAIGTPSDDTVIRDKGGVYVYGASFPEIVVEGQPVQGGILDGGSQSFGSVFASSGASLGFTIRNSAPASALTGLATTIDGANAADFSVTTSPAAPVSGPNGSTSFIVRFAPTTPGVKTATLHLSSNDQDENPFDINLVGTGLEPVIQVVEQGAPASLSANAAGASSVQWRKDGVDIPGAVGSTLTLPSVQPWQVGIYSARVTTAAGSSVSDVAVLGLTDVPTGIWRGLVACYPFDGNTQDLCRAGKPAILVNTTQLVADAQRGGVAHVQGKGFFLPPAEGEPVETQGPGGYLQIPRPPLVDGEPFTLALLIKEEGFSYWHGETLVTMGEGAVSAELLSHYWIGHAAENYGGPIGPVAPHASDHVMNGHAVALSNATWAAFTVVGEGTALRFYRNGQLIGTSTYPKATAGDFFLGRHWWVDPGVAGGLGSSTRLIAKVDDLRIYNRALTTPEVQQLFSVVQTTPPAGSFESWALVQGLNGADAVRSGDGDRDGLTSWEEYCFGTSPANGTESLMKAVVVGATLTLTWFEKDGVVYGLKESSDLLTPWTASAKVPATAPDQAGVPAGYRRMQVTLPVSAPGTPDLTRFFRVEATKAP